MNFFRLLSAVALACIFPACASNLLRDDSHLVHVDDNHGYYILRTGSPLAVQLGFTDPPTSSTTNSDPDRAGYGKDAIAFCFDKGGVLAAAPAYFSQMTPNASLAKRLVDLKVGVSTWAEIDGAFHYKNVRREMPDGGSIVYKVVPVFNPLEDEDQGN